MSVIQKPRTVHRKAQLPAGRRRDKKRPAAGRAVAPVGGCFLDYTFPPLIEESWRFLNRQQEVEGAVFSSLRNVCALYRLTEPVGTDLFYPVNIHTAFQQVEAELREQQPDVHLHLFQQEAGTICAGTIKTFGATEFFIPVEPLHRLLERKKPMNTARLMISLMAWLYQVVDIAYYTDESTYVSYTHECIESMLVDCEGEYEPEEFLEHMKDVEKAKQAGQMICELIRKPYALKQFEKRVISYEPHTLLESVFAETAKQALELYRQFPKRSFMDKVQTELDGEDQDYYETIQVDKYLSFHWSRRGFLCEQLWEHVNNDTAEAMYTEEPQSIQLFDTPQAVETHDFTFEQRLYDVLDAFIYFLKNMP
jgi:hypothetical protein